MNPIGVVLVAGLLMVSAVSGSSSNYLRRRNNQYSQSGSSEEYNRYPSSQYNYNKYRANVPVKRYGPSVYGAIPATFDARRQWANCPSIASIPDQGCCDSSYALIPTAVMTDRTCIATNSTELVYSSFDPIVCCKDCALFSKNKCRGGDPVAVWNYWANGGGIVTSSCLPYTYYTSCLGQSCPLQCTPGNPSTVATDKHVGLQYYNVNYNVGDIQAEIMSYGPVESEIDMYLDFANYDGTGVYVNSDSIFLAKHSVKIIGWGTEGNTQYWLIVNTFNKQWGNGGTAKFLRGRDHMGIETNVRAAMPNV